MGRVHEGISDTGYRLDDRRDTGAAGRSFAQIAISLIAVERVIKSDGGRCCHWIQWSTSRRAAEMAATGIVFVTLKTLAEKKFECCRGAYRMRPKVDAVTGSGRPSQELPGYPSEGKSATTATNMSVATMADLNQMGQITLPGDEKSRNSKDVKSLSRMADCKPRSATTAARSRLGITPQLIDQLVYGASGKHKTLPPSNVPEPAITALWKQHAIYAETSG